jgi:hypothetical protein
MTAPTPRDWSEAALARFQTIWPPERCKLLRDAVCGTPAERDAANAAYAARAMAPETPADDAVADLIAPTRRHLADRRKAQENYRRDRRNAGRRAAEDWMKL